MKKLVFLLIFLWPGLAVGADLDPDQDATVSNQIVAPGDSLVIDNTGITVQYSTIVGTSTVSEDATATNVIFYGDIALGNGDTLTATYCTFMQSETEIEASGGTVADKTGCSFETNPALDSNYAATVKLAGTWISSVPYDYNGHARWRYDKDTAGWFTQIGALNMPGSVVFDLLGIIAIDSDHPQAGPFSGRWIEWYRNTFRRVR